jgi:NAD(P)-dependent dehydrogenase (short-subunit alcohol dehydrogenase family)
VTLSSQAHRRGSINLADLQWENRKYSPTGAYGASKLANLLFSLELQQRLTATGSDIVSLSSHPGYSATNLQSHSESRPAELLMKIANRTVAQPADMGALPTLFAATEPLPPASYVGPNGLYEFRGYPTLVGRSNAASNLDLAVHLWEKSEELTGIRFPLQ